MIDFPTHEIQTYRFTMRTTHFMVTASDGNFEVYISDSKYMPAPMEASWVRLDDTDILYWIGVVYAYKVTDDTTRNVYDCQDYRIMGAACQMVNQVPEFEDLEYIIGYRQGVGGSEYADWSARAQEWQRNAVLRRHSNPIAELPGLLTPVNPLSEGAD